MATEQIYEFSQFQDHLQLEAQHHMQALSEEYVSKTADSLSSQPVNYPRKKSERIARRLIEDGERLQFNTTDATLSAEINKWPIDYESMSQLSHLFLLSGAGSNVHAQQGADVDVALDNFQTTMKATFQTEFAQKGRVVGYGDVINQIDKFLRGGQLKSALAVAVCTGIATRDTVQVASDRMSLNTKDFLDKINDLLQDAHDEARKHNKPEYPKTLKVVFMPCLGDTLNTENCQLTEIQKSDKVTVFNMDFGSNDLDVPRIDEMSISSF